MELAIALDFQSPIPLHQQLYEALQRAILQGVLPPRYRLPSTRSLAKSLGISRNTVTQSYDRLLGEGYLATIAGSGTYVSDRLPEEFLQAKVVDPPLSAMRSSHSLSEYGERLTKNELALQPEPDVAINFRYGVPNLDLFPVKLWRKLLSRHCCGGREWLDYAQDFRGYAPLREAISGYLGRSRAVKCDPEQILLTNGTQQAVNLILRVLFVRGEAIAIEDPGYLSAKRIFASYDADIVPIPVDASGFVVEKLRDRKAKLVYVTPSHQFPTGAILSLSRRLALLQWAQQTGGLIIEDDYDSEFRYGERPIPALQGLSGGNSVLYIGTFSKVLFPSLRIGYLVLPEHLVEVFARAKWLCDRQLSTLDQYVLTDFIEEGHLESHIRKMRSHYDGLRQTLVQALGEYFSDRVTIFGEKAGIHLMAKFHFSLRDEEVMDRAESVGVGLMSARVHYLEACDRGEFIFGYGELSEEQIWEGIEKLSTVLQKNAF